MIEPMEIQKKILPKIIGMVILIILMAVSVWGLTQFAFPALEGFLKFKIVVTTVVVVLFCWGIFIIGKSAFNKKIALIINEHGLVDNSSLWSVGDIPWSDIVEIKEANNELKQKLLVINVRNPNEYLHKTGNAKSNTGDQLNRKYGSPIVIGVSGLKCDYAELKSALDAAFFDLKRQP